MAPYASGQMCSEFGVGRPATDGRAVWCSKEEVVGECESGVLVYQFEKQHD